MKKQLLALSLMLAGLGMFGQSTVWQVKDANIDSFNVMGLRYIWAVDTNSVWALFYDGTYTTRTSNRFTKTVDGNTFKSGTFLPDTFYYNPSNIVAVNDSTAMISCYSKDASRNGVIMRTNDSGMTWTNIADTSFMFMGPANFPNIVHFYDNMNGWCQGDPNGNTGGGFTDEFEIYTTTTGGASWTRVPDANLPNPLSGEYGFTNVYTVNGTQNIWFGTNKGRVYYSTNGGANWSASSVGGMAQGVQGLAFRDAMNGFVWGTNTSGGPMVWKRTSNGGVTWTTVTMNATDVGQYHMCAIPGRAAYMSVGLNVGQSAYVTSVTTDDGATWTVLEQGATNAERMLNVMMVDSAHGWAGTFTDQTSPYLYGMTKYIGPSIVLTCPMYVTGTATVCSGNAVTLTGSGASTYTWSANAGSANTNTVSLTPSSTDTYTLIGTTGSCTDTVMHTITVNTTPTVAIAPTSTAICFWQAPNPNNTQMIASGATSYNWAPATGLSSTTSATVTANPTVTITYTVTGNNSGCTNQQNITITVLPCTGINEASNEIASIYPNPSKGNITVDFGKATGNTKVTVIDMIGKVVYSNSVYNGTEKLNIDLTSMPKGMYMVAVSNNTGKTIQKLIID